MSETRTNITDQLIGINVPNINESGYASQLSKAFTDINTNFKKLANRDFIKGENGDSVKIKEVDLITIDEDGNKVYTYFGDLLINTISSLYSNTDELNDVELENGQKLTWVDYFNENPGKLNVIYDSTAVTTDEDEAYSSLYYTFLDGRYANNYIGKINPTEYQSLKDVSCIAIYDKNLNNGKGGFNILSNAFPTIYYEDGIGLCWKVYGSNTGIPVQGIPGKDGTNSMIHIVQATITESKEIGKSSEGEVNKIFEAFYGFKSIDDINDLEIYNNTSALILADDDKKPAGRKFYFGSLATRKNEGTEKTVLYATCSPSSSINSSMETEAVINAMKQIDIFSTADSGSSVPKGLFIPLDDESKNDKGLMEQPVHLLSSTSITNMEGDVSNLKTDVIFTPVNDYNSLIVDNSKENSSIQVDKYLYLRLNMNSNLFNNTNIKQYCFNSQYFKGNKPNYECVMKYKLSSIVFDKESIIFNEYKTSSLNLFNSANRDGSRCFGPDIFIGKDPMSPGGRFTDENCVYRKYGELDGEIVFNHYESMPEEFLNCLSNNRGIYRWELCVDKNIWDIDELYKNITTENYLFSDIFRVIYTTDFTPGISSKILWFNGFEYLSDNVSNYANRNELNEKINSDNTEESEQARSVYDELYYIDEFQDEKRIIKGWQYSDDFKLFNFEKFVPIYKNDYKLPNDTSLNLNYNINITGDETNPKKSINVHGHVNCDDLNVHNLSVAGEIKNIYTKDTIIGDDGIKLGVNEDNTYNFEVNNQGNVETNNIKANDLTISNISSKQIASDEIYVDKGIVSNGYITINKSDREKLITINDSDIQLYDVNNIKINKSNNTDDNFQTIQTDIPVMINDTYGCVYDNRSYNRVKDLYNDIKFPPSGESLTFTTNQVLKKLKENNSNSNKQYEDILLNSKDFKTSYTTVLSRVKSDHTKTLEISDYNKTFDLQTDNKYIIDKINLKQLADENYYINNLTPITIGFTKNLVCHLCIVGKCSYSEWPKLGDTYFKISAYYHDGKNYIKAADDISIKKYTFGSANSSWSGDKDNGEGWGDNYKDHYRYRTYSFRPYDIKISSKEILNTIASDVKTKSTCEIVIVVESLYMYAYSNNKTIRGLQMYLPRPYDNTKSASSTTINTYNSLSVGFKSSCNSLISLNVNCYKDINPDNNQPITIICKDGIVFAHDEHIFSIGRSWWPDDKGQYPSANQPIITYKNYNYDDGTYDWHNFEFAITDLYYIKIMMDEHKKSTAALYGI